MIVFHKGPSRNEYTHNKKRANLLVCILNLLQPIYLKKHTVIDMSCSAPCFTTSPTTLYNKDPFGYPRYNVIIHIAIDIARGHFA